MLHLTALEIMKLMADSVALLEMEPWDKGDMQLIKNLAR